MFNEMVQARRLGLRGALALVLAAVFASVAAQAVTPEEGYIAARDRHIAALAKIKNDKVRDTQNDKAIEDLEQKLRPIVGPLSVAGFPSVGKLNFDTLMEGDEEFGMLDALVFGERDGDRLAVVTTDALLDRWLQATSKDDLALPATASEAVKSDLFYVLAAGAGAAVVSYAELPVAVPADAKFAHAMLTARTQDESPDAPDEMFVALERGGRVFIVEEKLKTPVKPIAACEEQRTADRKKAEAANDKASAASGPDQQRLSDEEDKLRDAVDPAFRACFAKNVVGAPELKSATDQAAAIIAAFAR